MKIKSLSYRLSEQTPAYGNGSGLSLVQTRNMSQGDTSNNHEISMPLHLGTHMDFPFHFHPEGKKSTDYREEDLVFTKIGIIECYDSTDYLIKSNHLPVNQLDKELDFLLIKTGFGIHRGTEKYWNFGLGLHKEVASFLKSHFPNLKGVGFDLISLNSYQQRLHGREAHVSFLFENDLLIVEDMCLQGIDSSTKISELILSPWWIDGVDGLPVNVLAKCE